MSSPASAPAAAPSPAPPVSPAAAVKSPAAAAAAAATTTAPASGTPVVKKQKEKDDELRKAGKGPYSLPLEDNGQPQSVYVMNSDFKYRICTMQDYNNLRKLALSEDGGWTERHRQPKIVIYDRPVPAGQLGAGTNQVKIVNTFPNVSPAAVYDSLHDPLYRRVWDDAMDEGFNITQLDSRNDIGFYSAKAPWPLDNREFINLRSFIEIDQEFIIISRSVYHSEYPVGSKVVRALSYLSGYYLTPLTSGASKDAPGCRCIFFNYMSLEGNIPPSIINFAYTKGAPNMMLSLEANAEKYAEWKKKQGRDASYVTGWKTTPLSWDGVANGKLAGAVCQAIDATLKSFAAEATTATPAAASAPILVTPRTPIDDPDYGPNKKNRYVAHLKTIQECKKAVADATKPEVAAALAEVKKKLRAPELAESVGLAGATDASNFLHMINDAIKFVDNLYLRELKAPASATEYLSRLAIVSDGVRRSVTLMTEKK